MVSKIIPVFFCPSGQGLCFKVLKDLEEKLWFPPTQRIAGYGIGGIATQHPGAGMTR